jgi:hypothetical protein
MYILARFLVFLAENTLISGATHRYNTINFHVALGITEIC